MSDTAVENVVSKEEGTLKAECSFKAESSLEKSAPFSFLCLDNSYVLAPLQNISLRSLSDDLSSQIWGVRNGVRLFWMNHLAAETSGGGKIAWRAS